MQPQVTRTAASEPVNETMTTKRTQDHCGQWDSYRKWRAWDLAHSCQSRMAEGGIVPPHSVLAPGSALRSVPTVALSSAQVKGNCIMAAAFGTGHGPQAHAFQTHRRLPRRRCAPKDSTQADNNDQGDLDTDSSFREGVSLSCATKPVTLGGQFYKIVVRLVKSKIG